MPGFEARTSRDGDGIVIALAGECDLAVRADLAAALQAAVEKSRTVVVDLTDLAFVDSSGVHELVTAYHAARDRSGGLYVRNASGVVAAVLEVTGVGELLAVPDSPAASARKDRP
jgi:anti-sigma B factor antagonist